MSGEIKSGAEVLPPRPLTLREKAAALAALTEKEKRAARCCFTGHRPRKLRRPEDDVKVDLENGILSAVREGFHTFITGMACGTDIWAGNTVIRLKEVFPELKLIAAVPYPGFQEHWDVEWQKKYELLLARADLVRYISGAYSPGVCQARNQWMVSHSGLVLAVWSGAPGGTANTVACARSLQVPVRIIAG